MNPFREEGRWLCCALHAHTTNSDGELAPELLVRHYEWPGYVDRSGSKAWSNPLWIA